MARARPVTARGRVPARHRALDDVVALFRVAFGLLVLANLAILAPDWLIWYGVEGVLSPEGAARVFPGPRLDLLTVLPGGDRGVRAFFWVAVGAAVGLTVGCLTRTSALVVFLVLVSLAHRNPLILNGGDTLMRVVGFLLIFAPAGRALSVDRLWRTLRGRDDGTPPRAAPWVQRLIQIQVTVVYLSTVGWKAQGETWADGTALYYATRLVEFQRFPVPWLFEDLWVLRLLTWASLFAELALGTLVWIRELRYPVLLVGATLHLGIEYAMNIPVFEWVALACLGVFVEPADAEAALRQLGRRLAARSHRVPLFYDGWCAVCTRTMALLRVLDPLGRVTRVDFRRVAIAEWPDLDRAEREILLRLENGRWLGGFDALREVLRRLPGGRPLAWGLGLPGMPAVGRLLYGRVAAGRYAGLGLACNVRGCRPAHDPAGFADPSPVACGTGWRPTRWPLTK